MNYRQGNRGRLSLRFFSRLIPHLKKPPRPFGQGGASARYHSCFSLRHPSCRYRKKKSPCPYGQGRHTRYHLALYLGLSLTRTNASLTDFNEVLSGDTLLFHTGSHLIRLSVISKSSLLLILACVYVDYYRAEGWTLSRGHRKDVSVKFSSVIHLTVDNYYLRGFGLISISVSLWQVFPWGKKKLHKRLYALPGILAYSSSAPHSAYS